MKSAKVACIYLIINIENDKYYVGKTVHRYNRWRDHQLKLFKGNHDNEHLQSAYDLYGKSKFIYFTIETFENVVTDDDLIVREQHWMDFYDSSNRLLGYNKSPSAGTSIGHKHTQETKDAWSAQRKGKKRSPEFAASVSERMRGKVVSAEARENMSKAHIGKSFHTDEHKAALSERMKGNQFAAGQIQTPERVEARAVLHRGIPKSPEHRAKIAAGNRGKVVSEATKIKMSISALNRKDRA